jgi:hypothetical protein
MREDTKCSTNLSQVHPHVTKEIIVVEETLRKLSQATEASPVSVVITDE